MTTDNNNGNTNNNNNNNIRVLARFRPSRTLHNNNDSHTTLKLHNRRATAPSALQLNNVETQQKYIHINNHTVQLNINNKDHTYTFDDILNTDSTQQQCYNTVANDIVNDVLNGYNATIFAYGQTGSGKTYSMTGNTDNTEKQGIIPRCCTALFDGLRQCTNVDEVTIKLTFLEIYMEQLRDLLSNNADKLRIREDTSNNDVYVENISSIYVSSVTDVLQCLQQGSERRMVSATTLNEASSRSHTVFTLDVTQKLHTGQLKCSKLSLVDLAGSEKVNRSNLSGQQLEQAKYINKSLSALGNCISALSDTAREHVPYRDSALTFLLKHSLGGNCRTCILVTCSSDSTDSAETLSTLQFAQRAKSIKTQAVINVKLSAEALAKQCNTLKQQLIVANKQIKSLTQALVKTNAMISPTYSSDAHSEKLLPEGLDDSLSSDFHLAETSDSSLSDEGCGTAPNSPNSGGDLYKSNQQTNQRSMSLLQRNDSYAEIEQRAIAAEQARDALQMRLDKLVSHQYNDVPVQHTHDNVTTQLIEKLTQSLEKQRPTLISTQDAALVLKHIESVKQLEIQQQTMQNTWSRYIDLVVEETKMQQQMTQQQIQDAVSQYAQQQQHVKFVKPIQNTSNSGSKSLFKRHLSYDAGKTAVGTTVKQWFVHEKIYHWLGSKWHRRSLELTTNALFLYTLADTDNTDTHQLPQTGRLVTSILLDEQITIENVEHKDLSIGVVLQWSTQKLQIKASDKQQQADIYDTLNNAFTHKTASIADIVKQINQPFTNIYNANDMLETQMQQHNNQSTTINVQ